MNTKALQVESDLMEDYFERLARRLEGRGSIERKLYRVQQFAEAAEKHFKRLTVHRASFKHALEAGNKAAIGWEKEILYALLYEIMDHTYGVCNMLELDELDLCSSLDGLGLAGDSAPAVVRITKILESQCVRVLALEKELGLHLDFKFPVDEIKGVTYEISPHWKDFIHGSVGESFTQYFLNVQQQVHSRLISKPKFWRDRTIEQHLMLKQYNSLLRITRRLNLIVNVEVG